MTPPVITVVSLVLGLWATVALAQTTTTVVTTTTTTQQFVPTPNTTAPRIPEVLESAGDHAYPDRIRLGPFPCSQLEPNATEGTATYCDRCVAGTVPCLCNMDPTCVATKTCGSFAQFVQGIWVCGGGCPTTECPPGQVVGGITATCGATCTTPTCVPFECPDGSVVIGQDDMCNLECGPLFPGCDCTPTGICAIDPNGVCTCCPTTTTTPTTSTTSTSGVGTTTSAPTTTSSTTSTTLVSFDGQACVTVDGLAGDGSTVTDDDYGIWFPVDAATVTGFTCHCSGTCSAPTHRLQFFDRIGNLISITGPPDLVSGGSLICETGTANSRYALILGGETDQSLVAGEGVKFNVTNNAASIVDNKVIVCVTYTVP